MQNCKQLKQKDADLIRANARLGEATQAFEGVEAALKSKIDTLQKEKSSMCLVAHSSGILLSTCGRLTILLRAL